jgi:hypothetical protein
VAGRDSKIVSLTCPWAEYCNVKINRIAIPVSPLSQDVVSNDLYFKDCNNRCALWKDLRA